MIQGRFLMPTLHFFRFIPRLPIGVYPLAFTIEKRERSGRMMEKIEWNRYKTAFESSSPCFFRSTFTAKRGFSHDGDHI